MSWREELRLASFRGVPFRYEEVGGQLGRWSVRHDFPGEPLPLFEDLGRRAREFRFRAYLIGEDVLDQRDRLLAALEQEGPGELVHPTRGTFVVSLSEPARETWSQRDGGVLTLELSFCESQGALFPSVADVPGPELEDLADEHADAAAAAFPDQVDVAGQPEVARQSIADSVTTAVRGLQARELPGTPQQLAAWRATLDELLRGGSSAAANPAELALQLRAAFADVAELSSGKLATLGVYRELLRLPSTVVPGTGATSLTAAGNARATDSLWRFYAFAGACRAAARAPWASLEDALAAREDLLEQSEQLEADSDVRNLDRMHELRGLLGQAVPPPDEGLPRELEVTPRQTTPSLALSYQLDGNVAGELDLVARNRPRFPGFLPGGRPLEVLRSV